jgi:hypothetical protein
MKVIMIVMVDEEKEELINYNGEVDIEEERIL